MSKSPALKIFLFFTILVAANCARKPELGFMRPNPVLAPENWSPSSVQYICQDEKICPDHQGVLLALRTIDASKSPDGHPHRLIVRCTATLYEPDKILTAGHCAEQMANSKEIFFVSVARPGRPSQPYRIRRILETRHSGDPWLPDYAAMELEARVEGVTVARPAEKAPENLDRVYALVANLRDTKNLNEYVLTPALCRQTKENGVLPLAYAENPEVFLIQDCKLYSGNSGGAVVAPGDWNHLLGVVQISDNAEKASPQTLANFYRSIGLIYPAAAQEPKFNFGGAANARCFSLPGWPRSQSQCLPTNSRLVRQLNVARAAENLRQLVQTKAGDWAKTTLGLIQGDDFVLRMGPLMTIMGFAQTSSDRQALALFPVPLCFERPPPLAKKDLQVHVSPRLVDSKFDVKRGMVFTESGSPLHMTIDLKSSGNGGYHVIYHQDSTTGAANSFAGTENTVVRHLLSGFNAQIRDCSPGRFIEVNGRDTAMNP